MSHGIMRVGASDWRRKIESKNKQCKPNKQRQTTTQCKPTKIKIPKQKEEIDETWEWMPHHYNSAILVSSATWTYKLVVVSSVPSLSSLPWTISRLMRLIIPYFSAAFPQPRMCSIYPRGHGAACSPDELRCCLRNHAGLIKGLTCFMVMDAFLRS